MELPDIGSTWKHSNGNKYVVEGVANKAASNPTAYPVTIVYRGENGNLWTRPAHDWLRSMTRVADAPVNANVVTVVPDWEPCNPVCAYENPNGRIEDHRDRSCSCVAAKVSILRQTFATRITVRLTVPDAADFNPVGLPPPASVAERRKFEPEFLDAVREGLKACGKKHGAVDVVTMAKVLYTNPLISFKRHGKMTNIENPHYLGRNAATVVDTIKAMK